MRRVAVVLLLPALIVLRSDAATGRSGNETGPISSIDDVPVPAIVHGGSRGALRWTVAGPSAQRDPLPPGPAGTVRVPRDAATIQEAVDRARPGGLVLIGRGVYHEAVVVRTPYLTIRGVDRAATILDGGFRLTNGIHVTEADGVAVENLTARHYLGDGVSWSRVFGYRGSYLTVHENGDHGVAALASRYGLIDHSYASGSEAGFAIGACNPCDAVITAVMAEHNALGFSGTNAGGDLVIVNSEWRGNLAGIVPNTLDSAPQPPQRGALIAGNHVHDNNATTVEPKDLGHAPFGIGIAIAGGSDDRIVGNLVEDQATYGIAVGPFLDVDLWLASGNRVVGNVVRRSGRADLALAAPSGGGDCFDGNDARSSQPAALELLYPCEGFRAFPSGGGSLAPTIGAVAGHLEASDRTLAGGDRGDPPDPPEALPNMPGDPASAPPDPAIPGDVVPGTFRIRDVTSIRPDTRPAITPAFAVMGVPLVATSWWGLLLGLYGYVLPFVLYATWVAVAMWDLIRRDAAAVTNRALWMAVVLIVPFVGPLLYFGFGGSEIPPALRLMLTAGGIAAYALFVLIGVVLGG